MARDENLKFKILFIDRCLFGKQEMRVVNIDDMGGGESGNHNTPAARGGGGGKHNGGAALLKSEDKNKPAKCMYRFALYNA